MRGEEREAEDQERKEGQGRLGRLEPPRGPEGRRPGFCTSSAW